AVDLIMLTGEADLAVAPGVAHDLHTLIKTPEPHSCRREAVSVSAPLVFVPAATYAHLDTATGNDVGGARNPGQVDRVAITHRRAHLAELDPRRGRRVGRHE